MTRIIDSFACGLEITICTAEGGGRRERERVKGGTLMQYSFFFFPASPFNKFASEYIGLGFDGYFVFCRVLTPV